MAFGDTGGIIVELMLTCMTSTKGEVNIKKGDALSMTGEPYGVSNSYAYAGLFGQARADSTTNSAAIAVMVRGVAPHMRVDPGSSPIAVRDLVVATRGGYVARAVTCDRRSSIRGTVLKVWEDGTVDVLL